MWLENCTSLTPLNALLIPMPYIKILVMTIALSTLYLGVVQIYQTEVANVLETFVK